ncbi:hypothetical protein [Paenibacillus daejeonensis]|uniref:hypothetical protein n=1 Tax=Paenibacillus daejeonensis TaxID=135193 RepID=UPI000369F642|nr:hypothetical protein [Paenibacillus daejeonensis]
MEGGEGVNLISQETAERIQAMEMQLQQYQAEMLKASTEALAVQARIDLLEKNSARHAEELRELKELSRSLQQQYDRLGEKIDKLESKLFSWMQQMQRDNADLIKSAQQDSSEERQTTLKSWMTFLQYVLGGTIFIIVAYVFGVNFIR